MNITNGIETNQTLIMKNVISYRGKVTQTESIQVSQKIDEILKENNAVKNGAVVTVTHSIEMQNGQPVFDIEIKVPLDKPVDVSDEFEFLPEFIINNALKLRVVGSPQALNERIKELKEYMDNNNLTPLTPAYIATVKEAKSQEDINSMIMDIYVSVK